MPGLVFRQVTAWFFLLMVGIFLWKMSQPALKYFKSVSGQETTATASVVEQTSTAAANGAAIKPPVKAIVAGTTTTTRLQNMSLPSGLNRVQVLVDALNVRQAPDKNSAVIDSLSKGTVVKVEENTGQWLKIKTVDNAEGYISASAGLVREAP